MPGSSTASGWLRLSALSTRRILPPLLAAFAWASALFVLRELFGEPPQEASGRLDLARMATSPGSANAPLTGAARFFFTTHGLWTLTAALFAPFLIWRAANQASGETRRADRLWLDVRPSGSLFVASAQLAGGIAAAALCVAIFTSAIALVSPSSVRHVDAPAGTAAGPALRILDEQVLHWRTTDLAASETELRARLSLRLISGGSDPVLNVEFAARRSGAAEWSTKLSRVGDGAALEVELPSGAKGAEFELRRIEGGARAILRSEEVSLFSSAPISTAIARIALRLLIALAACLALVLGLGNFVSAPSAASAAILPWILAVFAPQLRVFDFLPGGDLAYALEEWVEGRAAPALSAEAWLGAFTLILAGFFLAALGRRRAEG